MSTNGKQFTLKKNNNHKKKLRVSNDSKFPMFAGRVFHSLGAATE